MSPQRKRPEFTFDMQPWTYDWGKAALPIVTVRFSNGERESPDVSALVDSGATVTLVTWDLADDLGIDPTAGTYIKLQGLGGGAYACVMKAAITFIASGGKQVFSLPDASVGFTKAALPANLDVLLGQCDALERMSFVQLNHNPKPSFRLLTR